MMRTIGVVTVGRSDYGVYRSVLKRIRKDPDLKLHLIVAGMHLQEKYGMTINEIRKDGFEVGQPIPLALNNDNPKGIACSMGEALQSFSVCYENFRPDILMVLGDRFEMHAAALAALPFKIPVAHIHGGELTLGAIDNSLRHSITLLSHLHFTATETYRQRVLQLGEEPWRVHCTGAPALDEIVAHTPLSLETLALRFDLPLEESPILVTYHPVTLEYEDTQWQIDQLLQALSALDAPIVFTGTNADTSNTIIWNRIKSFVTGRPKTFLIPNFGPDYYFDMLKNSRLMVGNSSSGLVETPSFELPVVNIGSRQGGRLRAKNVIDVGYSKEEIVRGIQQALSSKFRESLRGLKNPYGDGNASGRIVSQLKKVSLDQKLLLKRFLDYTIETN